MNADSITNIGVDVAKEKLDVFIPQEGCSDKACLYQFKNNKEGTKDLFTMIKRKVKGSYCIVCESTGAYHLMLQRFAHKANVPLCVLNPYQVGCYRKALNKAKTDLLDAKLLSLFAKDKGIVPTPFSPETDKLKELSRTRCYYAKELTRLHNRLEKAYYPETIKSLNRQIAQCKKEMDFLEDKMKTVVIENEVKQDVFKLLNAYVGIGEVTAYALLAELPELGYLHAKQIRKLANLAPMDNSSGKTNAPKHLGGGRRHIPRILLFPTFSTIAHSKEIRAFYKRQCEVKAKKSAVMATMAKIVTQLNAIVHRYYLEKGIVTE